MEQVSKKPSVRRRYIAHWVRANWRAAPTMQQGLTIRWLADDIMERRVIPVHTLDPRR